MRIVNMVGLILEAHEIQDRILRFEDLNVLPNLVETKIFFYELDSSWAIGVDKLVY